VNVYNIDITNLTFQGLAVKVVGKASRLLAHYEDVNADGYMDLVVQFQDSDGWMAPNGVSEGVLTGYLLDDTPIEGRGILCLVP